jgi:N utilization substance protein B
MMHPRRAGRELALKAVFQVDVGGQPMEEVLEGTLDQARLYIERPVQHAVAESRSRLLGECKAWQVRISDAAIHGVRGAARSSLRVIKLVQEAALDYARISTGVPDRPADDEILQGAILAAKQKLKEVALRPSLHTKARDSVLAIAEHDLSHIEQLITKHLPAAVQMSGMMFKLARGVMTERAMLDERLTVYCDNWPLNRQSAVDRNILRICAYELVIGSGAPPVVAINEAVELAKKYSTPESARFIHGVLGSLSANTGPLPVPVLDDEIVMPDFDAVDFELGALEDVPDEADAEPDGDTPEPADELEDWGIDEDAPEEAIAEDKHVG